MPDSAEKKEAKSKKTAPQRLLELSRNPDPSVQYAVASNPNAPVQALEYLAGHGKFTILKAVAGNLSVTALILERLARHKQWTVCEAVALSKLAPVTLLFSLAGHSEPKVREAVLSNSSCTPKLFETLSKDAEPWVRMRVAMSFSCPSSVLEVLASDPAAYVRNAVADNRNTPPATVRALASDADGYVRAGAVRNARDFKLLTTLAGDSDVRVRLEIARLMPWSPRLHDHLVTDAEETVRDAIADYYEELPDAAALILALDSSDKVRERLARRDCLSQAVLEVLVSDPNAEVRRSLAYAKVDDVAAWVLERLASDADKDVRWQVAYHWRTPKDTLRQLEDDPDVEVRSAARYSLAQVWN